MMELLENQVKDRLKEEVVNVNGKEYISLDLFLNSLRESMIHEVLLGSVIKKNPDIYLSEEDILSYMINDFYEITISYDNGRFSLK